MLSYNANANLMSDSLSGGKIIYGYDQDGNGRIVNANSSSFSASYQYDPFGHRISRTVGSSTTQYLLDDQGQEWGEYDGSGNLQRRLLHDPHDVAPVVLLDTAGNPTWQQFDRQGSVVANTSGGAWAYLPFGDQPGNAVLAGTSFGYAGYRFDSETQTYHTQTRQYDPVLGRFLQTDPIGQTSNRNIYAYVDNTPFGGTDPSGLQFSVSMEIDAPAPNPAPSPGMVSSGGLTPAQGAFGGTGSGGTRSDNGASQNSNTGVSGSAPSGGIAPTPMAPLPVIEPPPPFDPAAIQLPRIISTQSDYNPEPGLGNGGEGLLLALLTVPFSGEVIAAEEAGLSGTALARSLGQAGEDAVGITGPKVSIEIPGSGQIRIPDALTDTTLTEVKNVGSLSYTQQLQDFTTYSQANGLDFQLYVRPSTQLSGPLQQAITNGQINLNFIPGAP